MSDAPNPFAAPLTESTPVADELPDLHGRMPSSVVLAMVCVAIVLALNLLLALGLAVDGFVGVGELAVVGVPLVIGVLVFVGLLRRSRLARQWARVFGLLGAVLATLAIVLYAAWFFFFAFSGEFGSPRIFVDNSAAFFFGLLIAFSIYALPAALFWTIFFALGRDTARQYFNLFCPQCRSRRTKAVNFFYTQSRCKECDARW